MSFRKILVAGWMGAILLFASQAMACKCDSLVLREHAEKSDVIFSGTCLRVATNPLKGGLNVVFQVDSSWKRKIEHTATVHTDFENQCGYHFTAGKKYLVFCSKRHQNITTSSCMPNQTLHKVSDQLLVQLGSVFPPGRPQMEKKMNLILIFLGVGGLLFMAFVVLRKKIFKPKS